MDKSAPVCAGDLAVQKKKVDQLREWLENHPGAPQGCCGSRVLLLTGEGLEICELCAACVARWEKRWKQTLRCALKEILRLL